jgi:hypothetical protein
MANAGRCFLNVPFKEYLKGLKLDAEGQVDEESLRIAASREFENYKAIERRINDLSCTPTGAQIYCARAVDSGLCGETMSLEASLPVTLSQRSTMAIHIVFSMEGGGVTSWESGMQRLWHIDPPPEPSQEVAGPIAYAPAASIATAVTRDAGTHTIEASINGTVGGSGSVAFQIQILVIVGGNTEDDCVIWNSPE